MEPIEFLRILRRRWRVLVACALVGLTASLFAMPSHASKTPKAKQFKASAVLLAVTTRQHVSTSSLSQEQLLLKIGVVPIRVAEQLHSTKTPQRLVSEISTTIDKAVGTITVSSVQPSSLQAIAIVNAFTGQLVKYLAQTVQVGYTSQVNKAADLVQTVSHQKHAADLQLVAHPTDEGIQQRDKALATAVVNAQKAYAKTVSLGVPDPSLRLVEADSAKRQAPGRSFATIGTRSTRSLLALLIGLLLGAGIALLLDRFDLRVRTKEDAEDAFGLPVVSEIPALWYGTRRRREVVTAVQPISPYAEVHRILRHSLLFAHMSPFKVSDHATNGNGNGNGNGHGNGNGNGHTNGNGKRRQVIVVTSAGSAEGKTTTVANLAASFAESGQSVLVMSCDFHGPRIQEMLGAHDAPGIANVLHGGANAPSLAEVTVETSIPGVWLAPSGDGIDNPPELASSVGPLMDAARKLADVVIIDTPALLSVSAASELLPAADVSVIVARSSRTTREAAMRVHERLGLLDAKVLGVVLVGPQIPSVSREYSGYSRPPGGWRKRKRELKKRDIQIGARADALEPTRPAETPSRPLSAPSTATATLDPPPGHDPIAPAAPAFDEPVTPAPPVAAAPPLTILPSAEPGRPEGMGPRPRWRRRDIRPDD